MINEKEYWKLYSTINSASDIKRLAKKGYDEEFLLEILTLKLSRETKKQFYKLPRKKLARLWKSGKSAVELASQFSFSPTMMLYIILQELGFSKRKASAIVNGKEEADDPRIKKEVKKVWAVDPVYSPDGLEKQYEKGRRGEERIKRWLDRRGIEYEREEELKKKYAKTPDFLLKKLIKINDEPIRWIESKFSIGDTEKVRRDYRKQLDQYMHMFGPGAIVYHLGVLPSAKKWLEDRGVLVLEKMPRNRNKQQR